MIDKETINKYKEAGRIANKIIREGAKKITIGADMTEVLDWIEKRIKEEGAGIAFPAQISLNNIAAHYCPGKDEKITFKEGDMAKLDIGVHIEGHVADTALTVNLGADDNITKASKEALKQALKIIRPGTTLGEIGRTIQETIESYGLKPIRNLSGHGLGEYEIHTKPNIPNYDTKDPTTLKEGMVIAIEPFATNGAGMIYESNNPTLFSQINNKPVRSTTAREILRKIREYNGLPFTSRWLEREYGTGKTRLGINELIRNGNLISHPPLPDKQGGIVSQHEHSVIVLEKPIIYTKTEEE